MIDVYSKSRGDTAPQLLLAGLRVDVVIRRVKLDSAAAWHILDAVKLMSTCCVALNSVLALGNTADVWLIVIPGWLQGVQLYP